jgi:hypothetical protein
MGTSLKSKADSSAAFNDLRWHDSKLLALEIVRERGGDTHCVRLTLDLLEGEKYRHAVMEIAHCRAIRMTLDLLGKELCGDAIAFAACDLSSAQREAFLESARRGFSLYPEKREAFDDYLYFEVHLIPPGGRIEILGKEWAIDFVTATA